MTRTRLEKVAAWAGDLPPLSPVATRVLELTKGSSTDTSALEREILHDQALDTDPAAGQLRHVPGFHSRG